MDHNSSHHSDFNFKLPHADTAELKSNQSVRATFKLSQNTILALSIVSNQLGVKQESLFDHLVSDTDALKTIAMALKKKHQRTTDGVPKTFVVSRKTISTLQKMADEYKAPRDALVEFSIQRLKPLIQQEKSKIELRKRFVEKFRKGLVYQKDLLAEAKRQLGEDDPICEQLSNALDRLGSTGLTLEAFIKKSEKLKELNL